MKDDAAGASPVDCHVGRLRKERADVGEPMTEGELWSFLRSVMSQGADIRCDYDSGRHKSYEAYSARLDAAAAERAEELLARMKTPNATLHPPTQRTSPTKGETMTTITLPRATVEQALEALRFYAEESHHVTLTGFKNGKRIDWDQERDRLEKAGYRFSHENHNSTEEYVEDGRRAQDALNSLEEALSQQAEPVRFLIEGNEFCGAPPAPYATWGDALAGMLDAGKIEGLRISALAQQAYTDDLNQRIKLYVGSRCAPPQQAEPVEPVAKVELMTTGGNAGLATRIVEIDDHLRERLRPGQLLYTAPPQRKPLTQEEIPALAEKAWTPSVYCDAEALLGADGLVALVRAVEAKHGIKESP